MSATTVPCLHSISAASFGISSEAEAFARSAKATVAATTQFNANRNHFVLPIFRFMDNSHFRGGKNRTSRERSSVFADVFVPQCRVLGDKFPQHLHTFFRRKINHFDSVFPKPVHSAAKIHGFSDDDDSNSELANQPAAIPARGERRHHDLVAIAFLAPRSAKCIGFSVRRWIAVLNSAVVPTSQKFPYIVKKCGADRNPAFRESTPRLIDRRFEHRQIVSSLHFTDPQCVFRATTGTCASSRSSVIATPKIPALKAAGRCTRCPAIWLSEMFMAALFQGSLDSIPVFPGFSENLGLIEGEEFEIAHED